MRIVVVLAVLFFRAVVFADQPAPISFLALVLKQELESRMKQADLEREWKEVIRGLDALQQVEANFQDRCFLFHSQLTAHASQAVRATGVAIPPTLQELQ